MKRGRTIRGRIVLAIVLVGCIPLVIGLVLAYVSGMRSLRDGDKVVGLLIVDREGALVAASSEPDHFSFGAETWWRAVRTGTVDAVYLSGVIPAKDGSFHTPEETFDIAVPIIADSQLTARRRFHPGLCGALRVLFSARYHHGPVYAVRMNGASAPHFQSPPRSAHCLMAPVSIADALTKSPYPIRTF